MNFLELNGPAKAAAYLEELKTNPDFANIRAADVRIASYYFRAKQWTKAQRYYKIALKSPFSKQLEDEIQAQIRICKEQLKKQRKDRA